ncbi:hypothetical protein RRG08_035898 [Elysia crispata]|uniref:Uncharacterized protein n=1 Tax=Elysia crispata TaxID=231223 RepID=A0AAE1DRM2_9GAST|nr:hypothetical protein RRG08_035898 [Elysia crispata]
MFTWFGLNKGYTRPRDGRCGPRGCQQHNTRDHNQNIPSSGPISFISPSLYPSALSAVCNRQTFPEIFLYFSFLATQITLVTLQSSTLLWLWSSQRTLLP